MSAESHEPLFQPGEWSLDPGRVSKEFEWFWRDPDHMDLFLAYQTCEFTRNHRNKVFPTLSVGQFPDLSLEQNAVGQAVFKPSTLDVAEWAGVGVAGQGMPLTIWCIGNVLSASSAAAIYCIADQTVADHKSAIYVDTTPYWGFYTQQGGSSRIVYTTIDATVPALVTVHLRGLTDHEIFVNGVAAGSNALTVGNNTTAYTRHGFGALLDSSPSQFSGSFKLNAWGVLPFDVSIGQLETWARDWFGPFRQARRREYYMPIAGAGGAAPTENIFTRFPRRAVQEIF